MYSRRNFVHLALATVALPRLAAGAGIDSVVGGVRLGVQTYSFRDLSRSPQGDAVDAIVKAMTECGLGECELWSPQIEPSGPVFGRGAPETGDVQRARQQAREDLRRWRIETPLEHFRDIRRKFAAAGISIYAFNYSFNDSFSDAEVDRGFEMARALGAEIITASATLSAAKRVAPRADTHRMVVAMHNHSQVAEPNEFASPESLAAAMRMSKYFKVNLDIGHFTAGNNDPLAYLREHHEQVTNLHLKDRKRNQGENTAWGQGDTPIREVLQLIKRERWPIRAYVEYEHGGGNSIDEVKKCYAYARQALA